MATIQIEIDDEKIHQLLQGMDEYFRWRADRSVEASADEKTSLNGKRATQPTAVPA
jgi:hypothetical protein